MASRAATAIAWSRSAHVSASARRSDAGGFAAGHRHPAPCGRRPRSSPSPTVGRLGDRRRGDPQLARAPGRWLSTAWKWASATLPTACSPRRIDRQQGGARRTVRPDVLGRQPVAVLAQGVGDHLPQRPRRLGVRPESRTPSSRTVAGPRRRGRHASCAAASADVRRRCPLCGSTTPALGGRRTDGGGRRGQDQRITGGDLQRGLGHPVPRRQHAIVARTQPAIARVQRPVPGVIAATSSYRPVRSGRGAPRTAPCGRPRPRISHAVRWTRRAGPPAPPRWPPPPRGPTASTLACRPAARRPVHLGARGRLPGQQVRDQPQPVAIASTSRLGPWTLRSRPTGGRRSGRRRHLAPAPRGPSRVSSSQRRLHPHGVQDAQRGAANRGHAANSAAARSSAARPRRRLTRRRSTDSHARAWTSSNSEPTEAVIARPSPATPAGRPTTPTARSDAPRPAPPRPGQATPARRRRGRRPPATTPNSENKPSRSRHSAARNSDSPDGSSAATNAATAFRT